MRYLFKKWLTLTGIPIPLFVLSPNSCFPNFSKFLDVFYSQLDNSNNNKNNNYVTISLPFGVFISTQTALSHRRLFYAMVVEKTLRKWAEVGMRRH